MDMGHIQTLSETVVSMLSAMGATLAVCFGWLMFCRWFYRAEEPNWKEAVASKSCESSLSLDNQIAISAARLSIAGRGSPADRLFFTGLTFVASLFLLYVAAWFIGVTPASKNEREFIEMMKHSSLSHDPHIKAAITIVDDSLYISRHNYLMVERAFTASL